MNFLLLLLVLSCAGCSKAIDGLEAAYATDQRPTGNEAATKSISITGLEKGDFTVFRGGTHVHLAEGAIRVGLPGEKPLLIPASEVRGCTMICFGGEKWNVDLLVPRAEASISFEHSKDVYEWCWSNKLPMIAGAATRDWLYLGKPLPAKESLTASLASRSAYDAQARSACNGY